MEEYFMVSPGRWPGARIPQGDGPELLPSCCPGPMWPQPHGPSWWHPHSKEQDGRRDKGESKAPGSFHRAPLRTLHETEMCHLSVPTQGQWGGVVFISGSCRSCSNSAPNKEGLSE